VACALAGWRFPRVCGLLDPSAACFREVGFGLIAHSPLDPPFLIFGWHNFSILAKCVLHFEHFVKQNLVSLRFFFAAYSSTSIVRFLLLSVSVSDYTVADRGDGASIRYGRCLL